MGQGSGHRQQTHPLCLPANWFRIEYFGDRMLDRANWMVDRLKETSLGGSSVEVGVDYYTLIVGEPPNLPERTFNLVKYIQIRA